MRTITEEMKNQWSKMMVSLYEYLPMKYKATPRDWQVRKFIWGFKDGLCGLSAASVVCQKISQYISKEEAKNIVFACIPASSAAKTEARYKEFAEAVCKEMGFINGYNAIHVEGERLAIHETGTSKHIKNTEVITFDRDFFNGKNVLVFDDILTQGFSYANFACSLEKIGASVLGGLFLGKTILRSI